MSRTYAEIYNPAMELQTKEEAEQYLTAITDEWMKEGTDKYGEPLVRETVIRWHMENLGYWAGYFDHETRLRVEKLFGCQHPIFGKAEKGSFPSPAKALAMGLIKTAVLVLILSGLACSDLGTDLTPDSGDLQTTGSPTSTGTGTATSLPPDAGSQTGTATATATSAGSTGTGTFSSTGTGTACIYDHENPGTALPCHQQLPDTTWLCVCGLPCGTTPITGSGCAEGQGGRIPSAIVRSNGTVYCACAPKLTGS